MSQSAQPDKPNQEKSLHEKLNARYDPSAIEWVIVNAFDYTTNNGVQIRAYASPYIKKEIAEKTADEIFGPENWENGYNMPDEAGRIKYWIRFRTANDKKWTYRYDGSSIDMSAQGNFSSEAFEIALTFAEKRCWAKVGIGRYLKTVPHTEVEISTAWMANWNQYSFRSKVETKEWKGKKVGIRKKFYWQEPSLPEWALPEGFTYDKKTSPAAPQPAPEKKPPSTSSEATDQQWKMVMSYYDNLPEDAQLTWDAYLFKAEVDEENGEILSQSPKKLTKAYMGKLIASLEAGYGKINTDGLPEKLADQPATELEKEIIKQEKKGVTPKEIADKFDGEPEKK